MAESCAYFKIPDDSHELLSSRRVEKAAAEFYELDHDQDGKISLQDYLDHLLTLEKERLLSQFNYLDKDHDGFIEFEDFLHAKEPHYLVLRKIKEHDLDGDGLLTFKEALQSAEDLCFPFGPDELAEILTAIDRDGDGLVSYHEYFGVVLQHGLQ